MNDSDMAAGAPPPVADAALEMLGLNEVGGSACALLTPAMKAKLRDMQPGQVLEVRVDDPAAREDIASWVRLTGHTLLAVQETPRAFHFYVRKKQA
ncbi:MAG TPA: sulfurtransferase TusA family protein [Ktedonobacterales bacterium]